MPNKDSARKALRQNVKRAAANIIRRDAFKDAVKKVVKAGSKEEAKKMIAVAQKALDKAAQRGVIKKNTARRKLSRLMLRVEKSA